MQKTVYCWIFLVVVCVSCGKRQDYLEDALRLAGDNRPELEKVLAHYRQHPKDSLKYRAAVFLIENMDCQFFFDSPQLDAYYNKVDSIFSMNGRFNAITKEQDSLLNLLQKPDLKNFKPIPDLQRISTEFLIDNIDRAFEAWKSPFAKDLNFEEFCEFLLPYKVNASDYPNRWRSTYYNSFYPYVKFALDTVCRLESGVVFQYPKLELDGSRYIPLPDHLFDTLPDFTVCCWAKPDESRVFARVFDLGADTLNYICFVPYTQDKTSQFEAVTPASWNNALSDSLTLSQLSHIAVTYTKNQLSFYIDGILKKRMKTSLTNKDLVNNYIGKSHFNKDPYFKGEIDSFRIYNRELNYAEISALAGKTNLPDKRQRLFDLVTAINNLCHVYYEPSFISGYRPVQLMNLKKGTCADYTTLCTYIFRSLGIPSGIDFFPQWATRSMGHEWDILYTDKNRIEDYSLGTDGDSIGTHFHYYQITKEKASKIFRKTFAKQPDNPALQNRKREDLPSTFRNPCIRDVTDSYLDCMDITVSLTQQPQEKRQYAYLCNFNNRDWIPVNWGKIKGKKAAFNKMGKDVAYLPVYYNQKSILPAADPFILTKDGEIQKLIPNHSETQTLILKRKYKSGDVPKKGELLMGSKFQVANKPDFSDSLTVYTINDVPEILYNKVNLALDKPYRYFWFLSPPNSQGAEMSEIEVFSSESGTKLSGEIIGNKHCVDDWEAEKVFDGDPLTSYKCVWGEKGWVGLDFGKPVNIAYFRYLPRNDDNFIKEGETYELFYWENYQWNSLGRQTGTSKQYLEYTNAPTNALFWLRNLTKGKEERIFTYENGKQVWW